MTAQSGGAEPGAPIRTVVFDLGGVLIDWNPRHLYRKLIPDAGEMERFLGEVCTPAWNEEQDAGRSWAEAVALLAAEHPGQLPLIEAYHLRWEEMLGGAIEETVAVLGELRGRVPLYALTNWSNETFPIARRRFPFLDWFDGILVSGEVRLKKPDPAIFRLLAERFGLDPRHTVFIDDAPRNIAAAAELGFDAIHFTTAATLREALRARGLLP